jgi:putative redox protein
MVKITMVYEDGLHCRLTHGPSGAQIDTDAPKDNMGKGESFSPTDLVASALGSCMLTTMGIYAQRQNIDITGASAEVTKEMSQDMPRRIIRLGVSISMPKRIAADQRAVLERTALNCPVAKSLDPAVEVPARFTYAE